MLPLTIKIEFFHPVTPIAHYLNTECGQSEKARDESKMLQAKSRKLKAKGRKTKSTKSEMPSIARAESDRQTWKQVTHKQKPTRNLKSGTLTTGTR